MITATITKCQKCNNICTCNFIKNIKLCIECRNQYWNY